MRRPFHRHFEEIDLSSIAGLMDPRHHRLSAVGTAHADNHESRSAPPVALFPQRGFKNIDD
jgi:hypothetical protein